MIVLSLARNKMVSNTNKKQNKNAARISIGDLTLMVEAGYKNVEFVLDEFDIDNNDLAMPSLDVVTKVVSHAIGGNELDVISCMQRPVFLLIPIASGIRYLEALNKWVGCQQIFSDSKSIDSDVEESYVFVSDWGQGAIDRLEKRNNISGGKIVGWRWAFVDSVTGADKPSDADDVLINRIETFKKTNGDGIALYEYMMLVMLSLKNGDTVDQHTWTVMTGEPTYNDSVLGGYFDSGYAYLQMSIVGVPYPAARFRSMVSGSF